jgi:hypothetical protein
MGSLGKEACEQRGPKGKERGGSGTGTRVRIESQHGCWEQRGVLCDTMRKVRHNAAATRERHMWAPPQMASTGHVVTATRRAYRCQTGHRNDVKSGNSISLTYVWANFPTAFLFLLFLSSKTMLPLLGRAPLYQLVVDFPFEHTNIFTKENICSKSSIAV